MILEGVIPTLNSEPAEVTSYGRGIWAVEQIDQDGGVMQTEFRGPHAEWRARTYARALAPGPPKA